MKFQNFSALWHIFKILKITFVCLICLVQVQIRTAIVVVAVAVVVAIVANVMVVVVIVVVVVVVVVVVIYILKYQTQLHVVCFSFWITKIKKFSRKFQNFLCVSFAEKCKKSRNFFENFPKKHYVIHFSSDISGKFLQIFLQKIHKSFGIF